MPTVRCKILASMLPVTVAYYCDPGDYRLIDWDIVAIGKRTLPKPSPSWLIRLLRDRDESTIYDACLVDIAETQADEAEDEAEYRAETAWLYDDFDARR